MKKVLVVLIMIIAVHAVNAQCPPGANAMHVIYIYQTEDPPPIHTDTTCWVRVGNFPASSKVYIYNNSAVLVDSIMTDAIGFGVTNLAPLRCLTYGAGSVVGTAVCGSCTTNISSVGLLPIHLKTFTVSIAENKATIFWQLEEEDAGTIYSLQESNNGTDFSTIHTVKSTVPSIPGQQYQYKPAQVLTAKRFYRLKITEHSGLAIYSPVKTAQPKGYSEIDIYPTIGNGSFTVSVPDNFIKGEIKIFTTTGHLVQNNRIITGVSKFIINSGKGIYYVRATAPDGSILVKTILLQ